MPGTPPRLFLVDQNLTSLQGHHVAYAGAVAGAAAQAGVETWVLANAASPSMIDQLRVLPVVPDAYWTQACPPPNRDPQVHQAQSARRLVDALGHVLATRGVSAADVLFFPNANLTVLLAGAMLAERFERRLPRTAFLFRREWDETARLTGLPSIAALALLRHALARLDASPAGERVRLFTDSDPLTDQYLEATRARVQTAPIPVDARLMPPPTRLAPASVCLLYLGDARREKGYHHLPDMAERLARSSWAARLRLVVQSNFNVPPGEPGIAGARARLAALPFVTLLDAPLSQEAYLRWVQEASMVLLPYDPRAYLARTSGILAEAICGGTPAVVPAGTWLSMQLQRHGAGVAAERDDAPALAEAVARGLVRLDELRDRAVARAAEFRAFHHPRRLVDFVCGADVLARARGAVPSTQEDVA
jgi:glycosyltransferase involved in cell wall biosynthesis